MCNEDGTVWITFNGEIYNFQELRQELEKRGHTFRTHSDTEVIIHAYEEYGRGCLEKLRGMFAFAIWDSRARTLFLARDRVGKKPLFYFLGDDRFLFASEIKALLIDECCSTRSLIRSQSIIFLPRLHSWTSHRVHGNTKATASSLDGSSKRRSRDRPLLETALHP